MASLTLHGTCVEVNGTGVLIRGVPGSGKSSLALQLIDRGAFLIADDQTLLMTDKEQLIATAPQTIKGLLEVRGLGLISYPYREKSILGLCVEISEERTLERLPENTFVDYNDLKIPLLRLMKGDPLGAIKIELKVSQRDDNHVC